MKKGFTPIQTMAVGNIKKLMFFMAFTLAASVAYGQSMSGTYTIDPSGSGSTNFASFNAAVTALTNNGVSGAVLFNVAAGVYNEQVEIPAISGSSASNTITFDGIDPASRKLRNSSSVTNNSHTLRFSGASYMIVRNLTIEVAGSAGIGVHFYSSSTTHNIRVEKCVIRATVTSSANVKAIAATNAATSNTGGSCSGSAGAVHSIYIDSNIIKGGYIGVFLSSNVNISGYSHNFFVRWNMIDSVYNTGIGASGSNGYLYESNHIRMLPNITNSKGIHHCNGSSSGTYSYKIVGNRIENAGQYGIHFQSNNSNTNVLYPTLVANNYIMPTFSNTSTSFGIDAQQPRNHRIVHNTVLMNQANGIGINLGNSAQNPLSDIKNNIVMLLHSSASNVAFHSGALQVDTIDYNVFYKNNAGPTTDLITVNGSNFNVGNFQGGGGYNAHSTTEDPLLSSFTDPIPDNICQKGEDVGILFDIYGNLRSIPPQIGASEPGGGVPLDAAMLDIVAPVSYPVSTGSQDIKVVIRNSGTDTLKSLSVNAMMGSTTRTINWTGALMACETDTVTFTGSNQLSISSGSNVLKVWTANPNGTTDPFPSNDTLERTFCTPVPGGTYTINSSGTGDFVSLAAFSQLIECGGIGGAITITMADGNYTDQLLLSHVKGNSSTNTITLTGSGAANVIIDRPTGAGAHGANVLIEATPYVTIKNITFRTNNVTNTANILITQSDYITIENCSLIYTSQATSSSTANIIVAPGFAAGSGSSETSHSIFENNYMNNAYYGIKIVGANGMEGFNNRILNNTLENQRYYGIYNYYNDSTIIEGNKVTGIGSGSTGYGIYNYFSLRTNCNENIVSGNGYMYGLTMYYENYYNRSYTATCNNNMVGGGHGNYMYGNYGLYIYNSHNMEVYHNSVYVDDASIGYPSYVYGFAALYMDYSSNVDIRNNIFAYAGTDPEGAAVHLLQGNATNNIIDYNVYSTTNILYNYNRLANTYNSLQAWQMSEPQYNQNSYVVAKVPFTGATDLHLQLGVYFQTGANLGIAHDVDGDARCTQMPTIGADESSAQLPVPKANFFPLNDTAYVNSPTLFMNQAAEGDPVVSSWYLDGTFMTDARNFRHTFTSTGSYQVKLVTMNCSGADSVTKTILVENPSMAPVADFIANITETEIFEIITLTDLSTKGATTWEWIISPDEVFDPSLGFNVPSYTMANNSSVGSQNPQLMFDYPGYYDICLVASNSNGSDTFCRTQYINVRQIQRICIESFSGDDQGVLYDDGGSFFPYAANMNCNFLIEPCASEVVINIESVDIMDGDYLRIYDGSDNTGTPLWNTSISPNGIRGFSGDASYSQQVVASSGSAYVEFESDASTTTIGNGFKLSWTSTPAVVAAPVAAINAPATSCINTPVLFSNNSQGKFAHYTWYVNESIAGKSKDFNYSFSQTGTYDVKLIVENCGGIDSTAHTITISTPTKAPVPGFTADVTKVKMKETVTLSDTSTGCANKWEWKIEPATFSYTDGTNKNSKHPMVAFTSPGCYDVKLLVTNDAGTDSIEYTCFIEVLDYCTPFTVNKSSDLGISRVQFGSINNSSSIGTNDYTDYTSTQKTSVYKGGRYPITISRKTVNNSMNRAVWIDFNQDGTFDNTELVSYEPSSRTLSFTDTIEIPVTAHVGVTRMRIGTNIGSQQNLACGANLTGEFEDYRIDILNDDVPPVITLINSDTVYVELGYAYVEYGATAFDGTDGDLTDSIVVSGMVDTANTGIYLVTYSVTDRGGNTSAVTRTVIVTPDVTVPVITLFGKNPDTIAVHTYWIEPGYMAVDNIDDTITANVVTAGVIDTAVIGAQTITYTVTDAEGNVGSIDRIVYVIDTIAPVITLLGGDTVHLDIHTAFVEPGVNVTDNYDTVITHTATHNIQSDTFGTYTVTYCATDVSGNTACINRVVIVGDTTLPTVTLNGADTIVIEVNTPYYDQGITVSDNHAAALTIDTLGNWPGHTDTLGTFTITYQVSDASGNITTVTRVIIIRDTKAPRIVLLGNVTDTIYRWSTYNDPGVSVTDNYDNNPTLTIGGTFQNTLLEGFYYITYQAEDQSGNKSPVVTRFIYVILDTLSGFEDANLLGNYINVYPNPNDGRFVVEVDMPQQKMARLSVVDMTGKEVEVLADGQIQYMKQHVDLSRLKGGVYFVRITAGNHTVMKKVVILN